MKLYKLYESVLTEGQAEACISQFGRELFSPEFGGDEPNSELEDEAIELIHKFNTSKNGSKVNPDFIDMARRLRTCVSSYPEVLHPEGMAFRGTKVSIEDLLESFDRIKNQIRHGQPFKMVYHAKTPIQSWSDDEIIAKDEFGQSGAQLMDILDRFDRARKSGTVMDFLEHIHEHALETRVPVVLAYRTTSNDFIFKGKYFSYLSQKDENEILRIDNRPIEVNAKIHPSKFSAKVFDLLEALHGWVRRND